MKREGYQDDLHFWSWGCSPLAYIFLLLFRPGRVKYIPITIGDLVEAAHTKRWQTPKREAI